jgi:hypothetical protein
MIRPASINGAFMTVLEIVENKMKADAVALARLVHDSEKEALRLGVSGVVVELLRMARIELTSSIKKGAFEGRPVATKAVRRK